MIRFRAFLALAMLCLACTVESYEPERPAPVPAEAGWVGGADGGVFVLLARGGPDRVTGTVYYETTGEVWYSGAFDLDPPGSGPVPVDDPSKWNAWDGESLHLHAHHVEHLLECGLDLARVRSQRKRLSGRRRLRPWLRPRPPPDGPISRKTPTPRLRR